MESVESIVQCFLLGREERSGTLLNINSRALRHIKYFTCSHPWLDTARRMLGALLLFPTTVLPPRETLCLAFGELGVLMHVVTDHIYWIRRGYYTWWERGILYISVKAEYSGIAQCLPLSAELQSGRKSLWGQGSMQTSA